MCDLSGTDLLIVVNLSEAFLFTFMLFAVVITVGGIIPFLVLYLAQALFFVINICYVNTLMTPLHLGSCYRLWWETLTIIDKMSLHLSFKAFLLAIMDLPLLLFFLKRYGPVRKMFTARSNVVGSASVTALLCLSGLVAVTELTAIPKINYFYQSRETESALIHRYGLLAYHIFENISWEDEQKELLHLDYGPETALPDKKMPPAGIILIQVESLDAAIIDFTWKNRYVTPFLHELSRQSIYYPYTLSYHKAGGSSDCEVSVLNSFEPLENFPTIKSSTYTYPNSVVRGLKRNGFVATAFHGNTGDFYNRDYAYFEMDFDNFYDRKRMGLADEGWGASDEKVMAFTRAKLGRSNKPFFSYVITMSSHEPFRNVENYYQSNQFAEVTPVLARNYLTSMAYLDRVLQTFVRQIQKEHPGTYIFIFGDHTPYAVKTGPYHRTSIFTENKNFEFVPLLIVTPDKLVHYETTNAASFLDIAPTVLAAAGVPFRIRTYGENLLSSSLHNPVPFSGTNYRRDMLYRKAKGISGE
jgi:phosphoglycerol transferase MdoB-like AlkP superfamily enzyme